MDYVPVPNGSGLPRLPLPTITPAKPPLCFLLVLVVWIINTRADGGLSRRELQEDLNRVGGEAVSANLKKLVMGKWLLVRKKATGNQAQRYGLGTKLTKKAGVEAGWRQLAKKLFDKNGLVFGLLGGPAFGHKFLRINGMLVLGTLKNSRRPLTVPEIAAYMQMFMVRQTVDNNLKKLSQNDLVVETSEGWFVVPKLEEALSKYEASSGALAKKATIKRTIKIERQRHAIRLKKGVLTVEQEEAILAQGCFNCHTTTGHLELEHFPPEHWGGKNHLDLQQLCLCWKCNNKYSTQIQKLEALKLDKSIRITLDEKACVRRVVDAILVYNARRFYRALNENRIEDARQISYQTLNIWCALIERTIPCRVTRTVNGKPTKITYVRKEEKPIRKKTGEIGTRYIGSRLRQNWPEGSAKDLNKARPL